ncbi:MAG: hypothetical protein GY835_16785 [bacterium]|nr:hypothetical protein [bacterium]
MIIRLRGIVPDGENAEPGCEALALDVARGWLTFEPGSAVFFKRMMNRLTVRGFAEPDCNDIGSRRGERVANIGIRFGDFLCGPLFAL